jgi:hypothetical protein
MALLEQHYDKYDRARLMVEEKKVFEMYIIISYFLHGFYIVLTRIICRFSLLFVLGVMKLMMIARWNLIIGTPSISRGLDFYLLSTRLVGRRCG